MASVELGLTLLGPSAGYTKSTHTMDQNGLLDDDPIKKYFLAGWW